MLAEQLAHRIIRSMTGLKTGNDLNSIAVQKCDKQKRKLEECQRTLHSMDPKLTVDGEIALSLTTSHAVWLSVCPVKV
jgi:hypothetical protein